MSPLYPDFPKSEFDFRYERARKLMGDRRLDGLLITERLNYIYFTGHRSCQNPIDKIRPYVFVLPLDRDPFMIFGAYECAQVEQTVHLQDIRPFGALTGQVEFIVAALKDAGLTRGVIGCEFGREQYLGLPYNVLRELMAELDGARFVDASDILLDLRAVKSSAEIAMLRRSCEINARAQIEAAGEVRVGMTEREVAGILRESLMRHGAEEITFLSVISPTPGYRGICPVPTDRRIDVDELIGFDVGVTHRGYCSDIARSFYTGCTLSAQLKEFYEWMMDVQDACVETLKPGKTPKDVLEVCNLLLSRRNLATMGAGRIGHGVGLESTEYPSLAMFESVEFQPGMVLACNPNFVNEFGFVNSEDNWVIGETGPELLSSPRGGRAPILIGS